MDIQLFIDKLADGDDMLVESLSHALPYESIKELKDSDKMRYLLNDLWLATYNEQEYAIALIAIGVCLQNELYKADLERILMND